MDENNGKVVITEDISGKKFVEEIIQRMRESNLISQDLKVDIDYGARPCRHKLTRIIKLYLTAPYILGKKKKPYNKVILLCDGDGNPGKVFDEVKDHVPKDLLDRVIIIVLDHEIEEWICTSLGIRWSFKPSKALDQYVRRNIKKDGYRKRDLPKYIKYLDINKLLNNSRSFKEFYNAIVNHKK